MSKFKVTVDEDLDLRIVQVLDKVTRDEIADFFEREFLSRVTQNLIWDLAPGSLQLLSMEELKELMVGRRDYIRQRDGGHTVFVAHETSEQMLTKWYKSFAETLDFHSVNYSVAKTLDQAIAHIREHHNAS